MSIVEPSDSSSVDDVSPQPRRLAVSVTKDALRQIRAGHPWVFDGSVTRVKAPAGSAAEGRAGDLAVIFDDRRRFVALGLYDPHSTIRIRVLHVGRPLTIDAAFFAARIGDAAGLRFAAFDDAETNGFRLAHGENDGLPGLVIDRFADVAVIKLYSAAWIPYLGVVTETVSGLLRTRPSGFRAVVLRLARAVGPDPGKGVADGAVIAGRDPLEPVVFRENGLRFEADVRHGHKTGFFLDQRDNRRMIRSFAAGRDVLDVFSFSGGFTVSAAAGGARSVHSVDINPWAVAATERNLHLNRRLGNVRRCEHEAIQGDAREVMAQLAEQGRRFGLVVVDPPSFASSKGQVAGALRSYGELTRLACRLVAPGGTLFQASCSARIDKFAFRQVVLESAHAAGYLLDDVVQTGQPLDHPVGFAQGEYLKGLRATVRRR